MVSLSLDQIVLLVYSPKRKKIASASTRAPIHNDLILFSAVSLCGVLIKNEKKVGTAGLKLRY